MRHSLSSLIKAFLLVNIIAGSFLLGYERGDTLVRRDVFKTCLVASIRPEICLQYMDMIKNKEYLNVKKQHRINM